VQFDGPLIYTDPDIRTCPLGSGASTALHFFVDTMGRRPMSAGKWILLTFVIAETPSGAAPSSPAAVQAVPAGAFNGPDKDFRDCMKQPFSRNAWRPTPSALSVDFARRVLAAYRAYCEDSRRQTESASTARPVL
jgi:hypothetical protein